jgi:hypothetical protein
MPWIAGRALGDGQHRPGDRHVLLGDALLDQVADGHRQDGLEDRQLRQLLLAHGAGQEPEEEVEHHRADDDLHQGSTSVR